MTQDPAARTSCSERIGIDRERLRLSEGSFVLSPRDVVVLPRAGQPPHPTLLCFHGLAMRIEVFGRWLRPIFDGAWAGLIPEGPYPLERRVGSLRQIGHAWYLWEGDTPAFRRSLRQSEERIVQLLPDRASAHGLDAARVVALGFSQGAYFAGSLALRHAERFRGLVVAGGRIRPAFAGRPLEEIPRIPILFLHGVDDDVIRLESARESAAKMEGEGFSVTFGECAGGHTWSAEMTEKLLSWLASLGL